MIGKGRGRTMSSFFYFSSAANSCQDQWPRYWGPTEGVHYSSTRGYRPRPRTNTLRQWLSALSAGRPHDRVQTPACAGRGTRLGLVKHEGSETSVKNLNSSPLSNSPWQQSRVYPQKNCENLWDVVKSSWRSYSVDLELRPFDYWANTGGKIINPRSLMNEVQWLSKENIELI